MHALLLRRAGRRGALNFLESVRQSSNRVATITPERTAAAIGHWIVPFSDQPFSLADAANFVVMTELGIRNALTLDHHFAVAGFVMLPHSRYGARATHRPVRPSTTPPTRASSPTGAPWRTH